MGYDNLAYQIVQEEKRQQIQKTKNQQKAKAKREEKLRNIKIMLCAILIASAAFLMISRYVELYETEKEITSLQKQLTVAQALNSQKIFELEQSVDLKTIEEIATTRLGMQRPEKYQTVYVNIKKDDTTEVTADKVEGLSNTVTSFTDKIAKNIVGIFSIK